MNIFSKLGVCIFFVFLFFAKTAMFAQQPDDIAGIGALFPQADAVWLSRSEHLQIGYDRQVWDITNDIAEECVYLTQIGVNYATKGIFYSSFEQISDISAQTLKPIKKGNKTKYEAVPVANIEESDAMMSSIFYSDYKEKKWNYPAVEPGCISRLSYRETIKDPHVLAPFYFASGIPTRKAKYSVTFPANVSINYKLMGNDTDKIRFAQSKDGNNTTYSWTVENLPASEAEEASPAASYYTPHVVVFISKVVDTETETPILENEAGLYRWYSSLVKNLNKTDDLALQGVVAELIKGKNTEEEKMRQIFTWIQKNIRYIAFEDGLGGLVPREAKDVLQKKYGDCKDMSSLTVAMLREAGIPAYLTWIGTRDKPYRYQDVPSPIVDNHMIASAKLGNRILFLDATGSYLPFGTPTSMIQGKDALIGIAPDKYEIVQVPEIDKSKNIKSEFIDIVLDGRALYGKALSIFKGYRKTFAEYDYQKAQSDNNKEFFKNLFEKGSNKFSVESIEHKGFFEPEQDLEVSYQFSIPDYVKIVGDKIYVNLNLNKLYKNAAIDLEKRKTDRESEYKFTDEITLKLAIPQGYTVAYLPPASHFKGNLFGYEIHYQEKNGFIEVNQKIYIDYLLLKKEHFPAWNKMIEQLNNAYQEVTVFQK